MPTQEENNKTAAAGLDRIATAMQDYARILRGEVVDETGFGMWNVICVNLEYVMGVKVITLEQWEAFKAMCEAERVKATGGR